LSLSLSLTVCNSAPSVKASLAVILLLYTKLLCLLLCLRIGGFVVAQDMVTSSLTAV
jgi:hypothetical protein